MSFGSIVFTNLGRNLQAKAEAGAQLSFTRIAMGDGQLSGQDIWGLTNLIHWLKDIPLTILKTMSGGYVSIGGQVSNQGLATGFYWREVGLFATDPDLGEILYCYGNAGALAEYIPADGGGQVLERYFAIEAIIGNASNVSATINESLVYVTYPEFNDHINNNTIHVTQSDKDNWNAKETPSGAQAKADAVQSNLTAHLADYLPHQSGLSEYGSAIDTNGLYTVVDYKRADGTLYMKSTLSNPDADLNYRTDTWVFYNAAGTTITLTATWTITYNANGGIVSKVVALS